MKEHPDWTKEIEKEIEHRTARLSELNRELTEEIARLKEVALAAFARREPFQAFMNPNVHENGSPIIPETTGSLVQDKQGAFLVCRGTDTDITERKRAREALERRGIALTRPLDETEGIAFEDLFNLDELQKLQDQFAKAVGVASLITRPDGTPITRPSNFCRLCEEIVRKTEKGQMSCNYSDALIGRYNPDGPTVHPCLSAGLCNAGSSISVGGRHIANWLIGQVRNEMQDAESMRTYARTIGVDEEVFMEAYYEVPCMSQEQFANVAQALYTLAGQLSTVAYQNVQQARFIAERKQAEEALRQSEQRFSLAIEGSQVGIVDWDVPSGKMVWSPRVFTQLGYEPNEFEPTFSLVMEKFIHPEHRDDLLRKILAHHENHQLAEAECRVITRDGTVQWLRLSGHSSWNEEGRPVRTVGTVENITERKQAEEARFRSEKKYRTLFDESRDGVYAVLREGEITDANPSFLEIFGYTKEELIGKNVLQLYVDPADRIIFQQEIEREGFVKDYELRLQKKDGTPVDCLVTASVQYGDGGNIIGDRGILRDLTAHKRLQNQLLQAQKMESIGTLAGGVAHDFNNLLTIIMGFSDLLLAQKHPTDWDYADLQKISHAAKNGADLVQRLLMFSRKSEPRPVTINLNKQIVQVEKLLRRTLPKMIDIRLDLSSDLPDISADPLQIEQVLMNLAVNASDAMHGSGKLTVKTDIVLLDEEYCRLHVGVSPREYVMLEISDTGHGMDEETVEHIFEPFFTTKEIGRGTGLGLAMVHGIIEQHKGHINVSTEVGNGTSFKVYLPAIPGDAEPPTEDSALAPSSGTETILLVDDEEFVRDIGERILTQQGYTVLQARDGREGLDLFKTERSRISLVILDLVMPDMGGRECLERLLKIDPNVKVLITSGYSAEVFANEAVQMSAKGFVTKPFRAQQLLHDVRRVLDDA